MKKITPTPDLLTPGQLIRESVDYLDQFYIQQKTERILARHQNYFSPDLRESRSYRDRPLPVRIPGLEHRDKATFGMKE